MQDRNERIHNIAKPKQQYGHQLLKSIKTMSGLRTSSPYVGLGPQLTTLSSAARTMLVLLLENEAVTFINYLHYLNDERLKIVIK